MSYLLVSSSSKESVLIRVEGALDQDGAVALLRVWNDTRSSAETKLRLDLSGLKSADHDGIETLLSLAAAGAELTGTSPYIIQLLEEAKS